MLSFFCSNLLITISCPGCGKAAERNVTRHGVLSLHWLIPSKATLTDKWQLVLESFHWGISYTLQTFKKSSVTGLFQRFRNIEKKPVWCFLLIAKIVSVHLQIIIHVATTILTASAANTKERQVTDERTQAIYIGLSNNITDTVPAEIF